MNLLVDALPVAIEIDGKQYEINSDFRSCLRIILAFEDAELSSVEKQMIMLHNLYPIPPQDIKTAITKGGLFLNGGKVAEESDSPRVYSFAKDANMIFSAFRQTHNIDLQVVNLHWWEFLALFMDLGADTAFCNLINLRRRVKTGKASKEEKQAARDMGDLFDVPEIDDRTLEEREVEAKFLEIIGANK
jgi:hypothetical protein